MLKVSCKEVSVAGGFWRRLLVGRLKRLVFVEEP
jgi:hypothetical protein